MSGLKRGRVHILVVALWLGAFLLLSCQPAQPLATPKPGEKATEKPAATAKPGEKAAEKPVRGGTLRLVLPADPATLDPHVTTQQMPDYGLYDFMIALDTNLAVTKEGLFKDWTLSGDGKGITFKLREGVKFHDGTDFDAAAAKFNIERVKAPATKSTYTSYYDFVASLDIVDSLTVRFNLTQPDPLLLARMGMQGGMVVSPAAVKKLGQDFGRKPVGTGAFEFVEWVPSDHITLKRFNGYWGKDKAGNQLPYLDRVVFQTITDPVTAVANLRTGQVDLTSGIPPEQLPMVKSDPSLYYTVGRAPGVIGIAFNTKKPPFDNKALRQAVALALDREGIASTFGETATSHASIFHPMNWGSDPKIGVFPARDLAKAKAKMAEAGYPSGGLKVKYLSQNVPTDVRMAEVAKANLAEIGIDMEIEVVAKAAWTTRANTMPPVGGDYQIAWGGPGNSLGDPGHNFGIAFHSQGSRNTRGPYSNPQVDQLIDKAGSIYDQKERTALYQEAAKLIVDDVPFVSLYVMNNFWVMNKKVRNFTVYADRGDRVNEVWLAP